MKTLRSIAIVSALFAAFLSLGMADSVAGAATHPVPTRTDCLNPDEAFVQDKERIQLFLLYHNPTHGAFLAAPRNASHSRTLLI